MFSVLNNWCIWFMKRDCFFLVHVDPVDFFAVDAIDAMLESSALGAWWNCAFIFVADFVFTWFKQISNTWRAVMFYCNFFMPSGSLKIGPYDFSQTSCMVLWRHPLDTTLGAGTSVDWIELNVFLLGVRDETALFYFFLRFDRIFGEGFL